MIALPQPEDNNDFLPKSLEERIIKTLNKHRDRARLAENCISLFMDVFEQEKTNISIESTIKLTAILKSYVEMLGAINEKN